MFRNQNHMKKLAILLGVVLLVVVALYFLNNRNRTLSPPGSTELTSNDLTVKVNYSRPSVRDRTIFGYEEEGALLPYGEYWRLGANEPTDIEVSKAFLFGGEKINAGKYVIYAIPQNGEIEIVLSSDLRFWGFTEPDYEKDIARTIVRISRGEFSEQFAIATEPVRRGVKLVFSFGNHTWELPIVKQ